MATMTVLQMVQNIMSAMDSDNVSAIDETAESAQVVEILKEIYFQFIAERLIPEHRELDQLDTAAVTANDLVYLQIPTDIKRIEWFKYDVSEGADPDEYRDLCYLPPESFMKLVLANDSTAANVQQIDDVQNTAISFYVRNDKMPEYWTTFDDEYVVLDSYDVTEDASGVVGTKTMVYAVKEPVWTDNDGTFVPDLQSDLFPYFLAEAKATCFHNLKQMQNPKVEKQLKRQRVAIQSDKYRTKASEENGLKTTSRLPGRPHR